MFLLYLLCPIVGHSYLPLRIVLCSGCVSTIESVLGSTDGVSEIHVDLDSQKATIKTTLSIQEIVSAFDEIGT